MEQKVFTEFLDKMQNKLEKTQAGIIADDLGILITENQKILNSYNEEKEKFENEKRTNEKLVMANATLLQQIGKVEEKEIKTNEKQIEKIKPSISWKDCFDEKGNFLP